MSGNDRWLIDQYRLMVLLFIVGGFSMPTMAQSPEPVPDKPVSDEPVQVNATDAVVKATLLRELEDDYQLLLRQSPRQEKIREAEQLLRELDDRSQWTNYSKATAILRQHRDRAAIPLLLRYCILHADKSSAHVVIPEYRRTLIEISGHTIPELYESGANRVETTCLAVNKVVENWWQEFRDTLVVSVVKMDSTQIKVMADQLLERVRKGGDFSGSGGKVGSAYHTFHVMYYRMTSQSDEGFAFDRDDYLVPVILAKIGYQTDKTDAAAQDLQSQSFPFEIAWILGEFQSDASAELYHRIVADQTQNPVVRLACMLALMRMGRDVDVEHVSRLLKAETDRQRRLICLLMLRWFDGEGTGLLLEWMQHEDIEIATAATCALRDVRPDQAINRFERLMDRTLPESPILLLGELADYEQQAARDLMEKLLRQSLEGQKHAEHLSRIVDACADSWGIDRNRYRIGTEVDAKTQGRKVLELVDRLRQFQSQRKSKLEGLIESLSVQVQVAEQIETLRRTEYKRLLSLQGDDIVTAKDSQIANERLRESRVEVEGLKEKFLNGKIQLESIDKSKPKFQEPNAASLFGE